MSSGAADEDRHRQVESLLRLATRRIWWLRVRQFALLVLLSALAGYLWGGWGSAGWFALAGAGVGVVLEVFGWVESRRYDRAAADQLEQWAAEGCSPDEAAALRRQAAVLRGRG